jgi:hypothetical protein
LFFIIIYYYIHFFLYTIFYAYLYTTILLFSQIHVGLLGKFLFLVSFVFYIYYFFLLIVIYLLLLVFFLTFSCIFSSICQSISGITNFVCMDRKRLMIKNVVKTNRNADICCIDLCKHSFTTINPLPNRKHEQKRVALDQKPLALKGCLRKY